MNTENKITYKKCTKCKKTLLANHDYFYKRKHGKNDLDARCKKCTDDVIKNWMKSDKGRGYHRKYKSKRYIKCKTLLLKLKINGCAKCGYNKCMGALDFHHVNPEDRIFSINTTTIVSYPNEKISNELNKCILLCANCHREITYNE